MLGITQFKFKGETDEEQFQSALRAMVVTTYVLFKAEYFLGLPKCYLIPEQVVTYLGIECDTVKGQIFARALFSPAKFSPGFIFAKLEVWRK